MMPQIWHGASEVIGSDTVHALTYFELPYGAMGTGFVIRPMSHEDGHTRDAVTIDPGQFLTLTHFHETTFWEETVMVTHTCKNFPNESWDDLGVIVEPPLKYAYVCTDVVSRPTQHAISAKD